MSLETKTIDELRDLKYRKGLVASRLENDLAVVTDTAESEEIADELIAVQNDLIAIDEALTAAEAAASAAEEADVAGDAVQDDGESDPQATSPVPRQSMTRTFRGGSSATSTGRRSGPTRGLETTGVEVVVDGIMEHLPTAFYHLLNSNQNPLVVYTIITNDSRPRRLRVKSFVEGYTATAVDTVEVKRGSPETVRQLPTLFPASVHDLNELTKATLNIEVEDLDSGKVEVHRTVPIWLLARTTAPRQVRDAVSGETIDLSRYLAAFVTPNEPSVMKFQRNVVEYHHEKRLRGYGGDVMSQVEAIYNALKNDLQIAYVHSKVSFDLEDGVRSQRVRLPRECIDGQMANCIDATLLFASLLEGISLNPAIALIPGHAFVGWQMTEEGDDWVYLETTMLQTNTFSEARDVGTERANSYKKRFDATQNPIWFQPLVISQLRTREGITPME